MLNLLTRWTAAAAAGTVDVTVTTVGGTSATSAADQFTYGWPEERAPARPRCRAGASLARRRRS